MPDAAPQRRFIFHGDRLVECTIPCLVKGLKPYVALVENAAGIRSNSALGTSVCTAPEVRAKRYFPPFACLFYAGELGMTLTTATGESLAPPEHCDAYVTVPPALLE